MEGYLKNLDSVELEKAKMVIGQFITSCSHSMRGPLKSITGLINLLHNHKSYSEKEVEMFLNLMGSTVEKMERTLDELEHFLENSKRDLLLKPVDCRELATLILHQFKEEVEVKKVHLSLNVDQPVVFYSDPARLRLILFNLITNAFQFLDGNKGSSEIGVSIVVTPKQCTLTVSDNGIGIDAESHAKIFQLFYRATQQSAGTGIGLYVVHEAIKKIGGSIQVESTLGIGSSFNVLLPNFDVSHP
jgi:signal transduction histidine kinase